MTLLRLVPWRGSACPTTGYAICFEALTGATSWIDPYGAEKISLSGTTLAAGNAIQNTSATSGDFICLISSDGAGNWRSGGKSGTWAQ